MINLKRETQTDIPGKRDQLVNEMKKIGSIYLFLNTWFFAVLKIYQKVKKTH